jgi:hypothetical protein
MIRKRHTLAMALLLFVSLTLVGCGRATSGNTETSVPGPSEFDAAALTQTQEAGGVTVKATWQGTEAGPLFEVVLDTHSVDLDGYDLRELALLRTDNGQEVRPTSWDAPKGGHHRAGMLTFPETLPDGSPIIGPGTRTITLILRDIGDVPERTLRWTR